MAVVIVWEILWMGIWTHFQIGVLLIILEIIIWSTQVFTRLNKNKSNVYVFWLLHPRDIYIRFILVGLDCRYVCVTTHWVFSSSSAATTETKGTRRLWWSSSRTIGSTASYRSLQMSPKMCAADAEIGWRRRRKRETFVFMLVNVYTPYYNNLKNCLTFTSGDLSSRLQSGV